MAATDTALEIASLVFDPAAGRKEGKLYSYKPTDRTGDLDFSRDGYGASPASEKLADGTLITGITNYLENSNGFNSATSWPNVAAVAEWSTTGDLDGGTNRAFLLRETTVTSAHYIRQLIGMTGLITFSFHAKKKDYDWVQFGRSGDGGDYANFNINNGTLGNASSTLIDHKIEDKGNGWYRCSVTYVAGSGAYAGIVLIRTDVAARYDSYAGTTTDGTYIQNAMVNDGMVAEDYTHNGVVLDYGGETPEQLTAPNDFDDAAWTPNNITVTGGQADKDGGTSAFELSINSTTTSARIEQSISREGNLTFSAYIKSGVNATGVAVRSETSSTAVFFNLSNGTIDSTQSNSTGASITDEGNGWYKCSAYFVGCTSIRFYPQSAAGSYPVTAGDSIIIQDASLTWDYAERAVTDDNLLSDPNDFSTGNWSVSDNVLTSGQADEQGGTDAWSLAKTSSTYKFIHQDISSSGVQTFSLLAKAGSLDDMALLLRKTDSSTIYVKYNLTTQALASSSGAFVTNSIQAVGNGFYLVSMVVKEDINRVSIYVDFEEGTAGDIYIKDARLALGDEIGKYGGLLGDMPRLDFSGGATCPKISLEESRTNFYLNSIYQNNFGGTINVNADTSIRGKEDAVQLVKTSASDQFLNMSWSGTSLSTSTDYALGFYIKYDGDDIDVRLEYNNNNDWGVTWLAPFEVRSSGVTAAIATNCTTSVESVGNDWYLCVVIVTTASSITPTSPSNLLRVQGASGGSVLFYQADFQQGSYLTSPIPTYGSTVTRAYDNPTKLSASALIGQTSGTIQFKTIFDVADKHNLSLSDGTSSNRFTIESTSSRQIFCHVVDGGTAVATINTSGSYFNIGDEVNMAIAYDSNGVSFFADGVKIGEDTSVTIPAVDRIYFSRYDNSSAFQATQKVGLLDLSETKLSDDECIALTNT